MTKHRQKFNRIIGIDLGGGKGKNTAVAVGQVTPSGLEISESSTRTAEGTPWYDHLLGPFLLKQPAHTLVAMDAPLGLPACLRCRVPTCPGMDRCPDPAVTWMATAGTDLERAARSRTNRRKPMITPYTQRVCEILLRRQHQIQPRETLGQGMGPLTARAAHLSRVLAETYDLDRNLIEVYPKATVHQLFGKEAARLYKREVNTWGRRAAILEALSSELSFTTWREDSLRSDHCFDAVICAYTAYLWISRGWQRAPEWDTIARLEGWIWFPENGTGK